MMEVQVPVGADAKVICNPAYELAPDSSPVAANGDFSMRVDNPDWELDGSPTAEGHRGEEPVTHPGPTEEAKMPGCRMVSLLCMVGGLEGADGVLLPCVFYALQHDLGLTLNDLAIMSMVQGLAGNFASPLWGVLADRHILRRKTIIVCGCIVQGLITVVLAGVDTMLPMLFLRALNGVFLSSLRPIANGIIADITAETNRGKVYGGMGIAMNIGTMMGTVVGTNISRRHPFGVQGWRLAFILIGGLSVLAGLIAAVLLQEPPRRPKAESSGARGWAVFKAELFELASYFRMPSFCVLIIQGCFGNVPWNALGYKTLFFQLGGITDFQASVIDVCSQCFGSIGGLLGGIVGDRLSRCNRNHGRAITAQISVLAGIPVAWCIFMQEPPEGSAFAYYLILMITLGLTATWCGGGVNLPILSEIVKEDRRATIMAWEGTLESSCSSFFGNAMVGILAMNVFGYDLSKASEATEERDPKNTKALGSALMWVSFVPWMLCFTFYTLLHWSYPRDIRWLAQKEEEERRALEAKAAAARKSEELEAETFEADFSNENLDADGDVSPSKVVDVDDSPSKARTPRFSSLAAAAHAAAVAGAGQDSPSSRVIMSVQI